MTRATMELVKRIREQPASYRYEDCRPEWRGFLRIFSFAIDGGKRLELMDRGESVVIVPLSADGGSLYVIEQPRYVSAFTQTDEGKAALAAAATEGTASFTVPSSAVTLLELPAGMIDAGETAVETACRELREETGIDLGPERLETLFDYYPSIGGTTEHTTCFLARVPDPVPFVPTDGDGDERITLWKMTVEEAWDALAAGRIKGGTSMIVLRELKIMDLQGKLRR